MVLIKHKNGSYFPAYNSDREQSDKIPVGGEVTATLARNIKFHRFAMALFRMGFENQDFYKIDEIYRKEVIKAAGYYYEYPDKDGVIQKVAKSISFEKMGEAEFQEVFKNVRQVIAEQLKLSDEEILNEIENFY